LKLKNNQKNFLLKKSKQKLPIGFLKMFQKFFLFAAALVVLSILLQPKPEIPKFNFPIKINENKKETQGNIHILVNPNSGKQKGLFVLKEIIPILENSNFYYEIIETSV
jgi:hypothetical protein